MSTFLFHTPGITIKIIRTDCGTHGRSCYAHHIVVIAVWGSCC